MTKFRIEKRNSGDHKGQTIYVATDKNGVDRVHVMLSAERNDQGLFVSRFENKRDYINIAPMVDAADDKLRQLGLNVDWKKLSEEAGTAEGENVALHIVKVLTENGNDRDIPFNEDGEQLLLKYDGENFTEIGESGFFKASSNLTRDVEKGIEYYSRKEIAPLTTPSVLYSKGLVQKLTDTKKEHVPATTMTGAGLGD